MRKRFYGVAEARGTFGDQVTYPHPFLQGVMISRALSLKPVKLKENVAEHDAAFGGLGQEGGYLLSATRVGFPHESGRCSGHSYFMKLNAKKKVAKAVKKDPDTPYNPDADVMDQYECVIDYPRLVLAKGNLPPIKVEVTLDEENSKVLCTQEADVEGGTSRGANDVGYCVVYDPTNHACIVEKLRRRSESGSTLVALPVGTDYETLVAYVFTTTDKGKPTSNSECKITGNTNLVAIARVGKAMNVGLPLTGVADKINAIVDSEMARLDAAYAEEHERARANAAEVKAEGAAGDGITDVLGDLLTIATTPENSTPRFAERVEILADVLLSIKRGYEEAKKK